MGLLSDDCRSQNVDEFKASLGDSAEAFDACNTGPMPAPMNATEAWQWAGAYPYQNLDDTVGILMQCVKNYMIGVSLLLYTLYCIFIRYFFFRIACKRLWILSNVALKKPLKKVGDYYTLRAFLTK